MVDEVAKTIKVSIVGDSVLMRIPKKRGDGYLSQPIYHKPNALSDFIDGLHHPDIDHTCGLDGYLEIFLYRLPPVGERGDIERSIIDPIAEFVGFQWVYDDFLNARGK